jgi:DNA (cytosine-5)-methyltransferase 1
MKKERTQKSNTKQKLKAVDFFCCAGGVTCGFRLAGIEVLGGIDIDGRYKETYERNNKGSKFIQADISNLTFAELKTQLGINIDMDYLVFVGCSPCQYYTTMQTDKTKSSKSKLLLEEFQRFVDYFNPGYIFIENVPGLETKEGSPLAKFKNFLTKKNYVFDDKIVNAVEFNVPQNRKRYVLVASRVKKEIAIPSGNSKKIKTVRHAISGLKPIPAGHRDDKTIKHWSAELKDINLKRIQLTPHDGGTRLAWKNNSELQLECYKNRDSVFPDVYGRMFWDQPSPTITTKFHSISNGRFGHPVQNRGLSLREGAILQSFPMSYRFYSDSMVTIAKMIGNAVPPELSKHLGKTLIKSYHLNGKSNKKGNKKIFESKASNEL